MFAYDFALPGDFHLRLKVQQPVFDDPSNRLLLAAYLPGIEASGAQRQSAPDLTITYEQSSVKSLTARGRALVLRDEWSGNASLLDLLNLAYGAMRLRWLRKSLYPVHSACVGSQASGYSLLVGHSGSGKTTIAMRLVGSHSRLLFSGNKTLMQFADDGALMALAGTRTVTTRAQDAKRTLPDACGVKYEQRSAYQLDETQCAPTAKPVPIRLIATVRLNDGSDDCTELSPVSALHRLYPYFMDSVYADTVVCNGAAVLAGNPAKGCRENLSSALQLALAKTPVIALTGSLYYVTRTLEERLCKS